MIARCLHMPHSSVFYYKRYLKICEVASWKRMTRPHISEAFLQTQSILFFARIARFFALIAFGSHVASAQNLSESNLFEPKFPCSFWMIRFIRLIFNSSLYENRSHFIFLARRTKCCVFSKRKLSREKSMELSPFPSKKNKAINRTFSH